MSTQEVLSGATIDRQRESRTNEPVIIALVNNMSDAALRTAEQQFRTLLEGGRSGENVVLKHFCLPEVPRSDSTRSELMRHYRPITELYETEIHGLIVTGAEPRAESLQDEPYWQSLTKLADWACTHTVSAIWSCLAAHGAVYHLDGIDRCALDRKLLGIFDCEKVEGHSLVAGLPQSWTAPHSRLNGLPEDILRSKGYQVLSKSADAGIDIFIKHFGSLFIFLQGHLEYYGDALFREYRRDVSRYLSRERDVYPDMPHGYFDSTVANRLETFRGEAEHRRHPDTMLAFPATGSTTEHVSYHWNGVARRLFGNWLSLLANAPKPSTDTSGPAAAQVLA